MSDPLMIGKGERNVHILPAMANRHGLIAGATGTGKTVTLQCLAEQFSHRGVPVFLADVKGDLAGISQAGGTHRKVAERVKELGLDGFEYTACPVTFWDILREQGHPVRTTISDMGPLLLGRLLNLNETQEGVLTVAFRLADDNGWLLLDLKDLRALLLYIGENARELRSRYGNVSPASVGAIQRRLLMLEEQEGTQLFGEPALSLDDLMQTDEQGQGIVNLLAADRLIHTPALYSTFLLWLLSELFEQLPEVGDRDRPRLVLFFDEAHLMFNRAPRVLVEKIEQVVRLIRSKGVGVYFVTQSPLDIPDSILGQLGNRVQHALRAFTPNDQKTVRAAAQTFRPNPKLDTEDVIKELGVGEALVSVLDEKGQPTPVERVLIVPPGSQIGPITTEQRKQLMGGSLVQGVYEEEIDRESAYEILQQRAEQAAETAESEDRSSGVKRVGTTGRTGGGRQRQGMFEAFAKSTLRSVGSQIGRQLARGLLGSLLGGRRR